MFSITFEVIASNSEAFDIEKAADQYQLGECYDDTHHHENRDP